MNTIKTLFITGLLLFASAALYSCHKNTCPTYATSGPQKKKKKTVNPWNTKKVNKMDRGKAKSGIVPD